MEVKPFCLGGNMLIACKFVEFHSPVFLEGKNFGTKLQVSQIPTLKLWYNTEKRLMFMQFKGKICFFDTYHTAQPFNSEPYDEDANSLDNQVKPQESIRVTAPQAIKRGRPPQQATNVQGE